MPVWLVTGGSGFLGRHLLEVLDDQRGPGVELAVLADSEEFRLLCQELAGTKPEVVQARARFLSQLQSDAAAHYVASEGRVGVTVRAYHRARFQQRQNIALQAIGEIGGMDETERGGREHLFFLAAPRGFVHQRRGVPFAERHCVTPQSEPLRQERALGEGLVDEARLRIAREVGDLVDVPVGRRREGRIVEQPHVAVVRGEDAPARVGVGDERRLRRRRPVELVALAREEDHVVGIDRRLRPPELVLERRRRVELGAGVIEPVRELVAHNEAHAAQVDREGR